MPLDRPLPIYQCHKKVCALKIAALVAPTDPRQGTFIVPEDGFDLSPFPVSPAFMEKHKPEVGGYWVQCGDGYESYSPAKAFEKGYTLVKTKREATFSNLSKHDA